MIHPFHLSTLTTSLLISSDITMPTPLLRRYPPACKRLRPHTIILALSLLHFVSWTHSISNLLLYIISTTSTHFPLIVPTLRLPNRTSHLDRCRLDDPLGLRCLHAVAKECGASVTPGAVAVSRRNIVTIMI